MQTNLAVSEKAFPLIPGKIKIPEILAADKFPSLDGMRAISILLVLFAHLCNAYKFNTATRAFITQLGLLGVQVFFVLSGFLITALLLKEKSATGDISLKNFYIRRVLRILPVAFLYLFCMLLLDNFFHLNIPVKCFIGATFFLSNLPFFHGSWYTAHYWSLSIEEQYYLVFPLLLKKFTLKAHWIIICLLLLIIVLKSFPNINPFLHSLSLLIYQSDAVLVGSLVSIVCFRNNISFSFLKRCNSYLILLLALLIILFQTTAIIFYPVNATIISILIAILLLVCTILPGNNLFYRFLNHQFIVVIGKLSFSIYIWQQFFTSPDGKFGSFARLPKNIFLIGLVSYISYYFFEQRFLRMKNKFK